MLSGSRMVTSLFLRASGFWDWLRLREVYRALKGFHDLGPPYDFVGVGTVWGVESFVGRTSASACCKFLVDCVHESPAYLAEVAPALSQQECVGLQPRRRISGEIMEGEPGERDANTLHAYMHTLQMHTCMRTAALTSAAAASTSARAGNNMLLVQASQRISKP